MTRAAFRERLQDAIDRTVPQYFSSHTPLTREDFEAAEQAIANELDAVEEQLEQQGGSMDENTNPDAVETPVSDGSTGEASSSQADGHVDEQAPETEAGDTKTE